MTDPISLLPPDLLLIIVSFISSRIINTAKTYHTSPDTVYAVISIIGGILYGLLTIPLSGTWIEMFTTFVANIGGVMLATSGIWHWTKKFREWQDKKALEELRAATKEVDSSL